MNINRSYISTENTYDQNDPRYIIVHNTDNFKKGADAKAHAKAQHEGNLSGMSAHYYVDDKDTVYQAAEHKRGCWHVGKNYGGKLFGTVNNRNSIGVEMCVQDGYDYEKAFQNTAVLVRSLMKQTGIPADRVLQHYDVCAKNCPSQIRAKGDWKRFKKLITAEAPPAEVAPVQPDPKPDTGKGKIAEDGYWGPATTRLLQKIFGTPEDGEISNQLAVYQDICSGILPATAVWEDKKKGGSALIKVMQKEIGEKEDGYIGPKFIRCWQKKLGTPADGKLDKPSSFVKALQHWANQRA